MHTDAGITGYGSVFTDGGLVAAALKVLEPLFAGENALEPERVTEKLHQNTFWMGRGGTLTHAISGIDIALWDILGKATGQPVGRLLGGTYRRRVQPYCSLLMEEPAAMRDVVANFRELGVSAPSRSAGGRSAAPRMPSSTRRSCARRARRPGPRRELFVDAGASDAYWPHGLKWALRTAEMLKDYDVGWFEEALKPDAIDDFCDLRRTSPVPIAGGEVLTRRQSFMPWLARGAFDIVQPDVTKVGGISEQRRIAWMAYDFGVKYIGHGWNTALGVAADLQLAAALAGCGSRRIHRRQPLCRRHHREALRPRWRGLSGDPRSARPRRRARPREARPLHAGPRAAVRLRSGGASPPACRRHPVQLCTDQRRSTEYCNQSSNNPFTWKTSPGGESPEDAPPCCGGRQGRPVTFPPSSCVSFPSVPMRQMNKET